MIYGFSYYETVQDKIREMSRKNEICILIYELMKNYRWLQIMSLISDYIDVWNITLVRNYCSMKFCSFNSREFW